MNAVAVLIIACSCAVGLAASISMMLAMDRGALSEILSRNAEAIERMLDIDSLMAHKTAPSLSADPHCRTSTPKASRRP